MPSADHFLRSITTSQWREWQAWFNIRGPFGPARDDFWKPQILFRMGQYGKHVTPKDLNPPWLKTDDPARPPTEAFLRGWHEPAQEEADEETDEG